MEQSLAAWSSFATAVATILLVVATFLTAHRTKTRLDEIQALSAVIPTLPVADPTRDLFIEQRTALTKQYFVARTRAQSAREVLGPIAVLVGLVVLFLGIFKVLPVELGLGVLFVINSALFLTSESSTSVFRFFPR